MKKMNIFKMMLAGALVMALASCAKENSPAEPQNEQSGNGSRTVKLGLQLEPGTKVTLSNDNKFAWEVGDKIGVWVGTSADDAGGSFRECDVVLDGSDKQISVDISGGNRYNYAVYPNSLNPSYSSATGLTITLPNTYELSAVSGTKTPLPMVAVNDKDVNSLVFYNLGGMLRLTVNDIPAGTKRLEIDFDGKQVSGEFTVASPFTPGSTTAVIATSADVDHDFVTVTNGGEDFGTSAMLNIPLPTGEFTNISAIAYNAVSGGVATLAGRTSFSYTAKRKTGKTHSVTIDTHIFSVSATKHVVIAASNLQATTTNGGSTWSWGFATNPWDYNGNSLYFNRRVSGDGTVAYNDVSGTVDLFGWVGASNTTWGGELGTTLNAAMYGISNSKTLNSTDTYGNDANETLKSDWGNTIVDEYTWRTLTITEWVYMLTSRTSGSTVNGISRARYVLAQINTDGTAVNGLIIFPNGITITNSEATSWSSINGGVQGSFGEYPWSNATKCTSAQWTALASKGCVFLPSAGCRNNQDVYWYNDACYYWSSTPNGTNQALFLHIDRHYGVLETGTNHERWYGHPVRLVRYMN